MGWQAQLADYADDSPYKEIALQLIESGLEIQKSADLFQAMYESNTYGFCTVGKDHKFHDVNDKCCEIWQRDRKTLQLMTYDEMTPKPFLDIDNANVNELIAGKRKTYDMWKPYFAPNMKDLIICHLDVGLILNPTSGEVELFLSKILSIDDHKRIGQGYLELENQIAKLKKAGKLE